MVKNLETGFKLLKLDRCDFCKYAVRLKNWEVYNEKNKFKQWIDDRNLKNEVELGIYYVADIMGDIDYPCIKFAKKTKKSLITMVCIAWAHELWQK